ncbi:MAG: hypothetical protein LBP53_02140 [Candidatus Peribacteria bacterium]|jgi:hypothetical protein|nr:hypothetical protein [Candidatus Peribacteria bacterium]
MLYHWIAQVKEHYPHLPIITHARQGTSYRLLTALSQKQGYKIAYDTKHQYANEDFHRVIAVPEAEYDAKKAYNKMIY